MGLLLTDQIDMNNCLSLPKSFFLSVDSKFMGGVLLSQLNSHISSC